ncbi:MAG: hypothetical protein UW58_C0025G0004 [Candidatus Collierbacteria bacterium GW2011_GWC2_44_30]|nr:MAG: hypothetical protein UW58_C0025G0004 [Candidatus Collierbacteria bacterium GW2011_GWC2_44_30]
MPRLSDILGLNARSADYLLLNLKSAKRLEWLTRDYWE